ncbi:MAG: DinB family protein [Pyrinomonadaceae bacterium]
MTYNSVGEIFEAIDKTEEKLRRKVSNLTDEQANSRVGGEGWSVAEIVEHIGIVANGVVQITGKLLAQAESEGVKSDGNFNPPLSFAEQSETVRDKKLAAPERVRPQSKQTIAESLLKLDEAQKSLTTLRPRVEAVDASRAKFPHPFFGDLNLYQWLVVAGLHKLRHLRQIETILAEKV